MDNLRQLISKVKESEDKEGFFEAYNFLLSERIKIVKKDMKDYLGLDNEKLNKEKIVQAAKTINQYSEKYNCDFNFGESFEEIEKKLKLTILEDIEEEFKKQAG